MGPKAGERIRRSMLHGVVARVGIEPRTVVFRAKAAQSARLLKRDGTDWRVLPQYWVISHFVSHRAWSETAATPSAAPISAGPFFPKARPERRTNGAARNSREYLRSPVYSDRMRFLPGTGWPAGPWRRLVGLHAGDMASSSAVCSRRRGILDRVWPANLRKQDRRFTQFLDEHRERLVVGSVVSMAHGDTHRLRSSRQVLQADTFRHAMRRSRRKQGHAQT